MYTCYYAPTLQYKYKIKYLLDPSGLVPLPIQRLVVATGDSWRHECRKICVDLEIIVTSSILALARLAARGQGCRSATISEIVRQSDAVSRNAAMSLLYAGQNRKTALPPFIFARE